MILAYIHVEQVVTSTNLDILRAARLFEYIYVTNVAHTQLQ